jgi:hypothetical protein
MKIKALIRFAIILAMATALGFACGRAAVNPWQEPAKITWQQWANVVLAANCNQLTPSHSITFAVGREGTLTEIVVFPTPLAVEGVLSSPAHSIIGTYPEYSAAVEPGKPPEKFIPPEPPEQVWKDPYEGQGPLAKTSEGRALLEQAETLGQAATDVLRAYQILDTTPDQIVVRWHGV